MFNKKIGLEESKRRFAIFLILPSLLLLVGLYAYPLLRSIYISFTNENFILPSYIFKFVGFKNYIDLFQDKSFIDSIIITFSFVGIVTISEVVMGMLLALLYSKKIFAFGFFRSMLIIPMMITPVCAGLIWKYMYHPAFGLVNYILKLFGISGLGWHTEITTAFLSVVLVDIWMFTPLIIIIAISGITGLPHELYEASSIDGASGWQSFTHITLPLLKPIIGVIILIRLIDAFKIFDSVWLLTKGGPAKRTELFTIFAYKDALLKGNMGSGSAASMVILIIVIIFVTIFIKYSKIEY